MTPIYKKQGRRYEPTTLAELGAWGSDGLMAVAAFRYCLGRMTYIVGDCERWIFANWEHFPESVKKLIQREAEEEIKRDDEARERGDDYKPLGHDCDRAAWERVRTLWKDKT
jgi:hypothetical protein